MSQLLPRYYLRRWGLPLLGALFFYGGLVLANELVRISKDIFSQGASPRWLLPLMATSMPEVLGMVLPMAAVLGGLLGTQSLAEGSELVASQGLGVGPRILLRPWAVLSGLLVGLALLNAHVVVPWSSRIRQSVSKSMVQEAQTRLLRPDGPVFYPKRAPGTAIWADGTGEIHVLEVGPQSVQHLVAQRMAWAQGGSPNRPSFLLKLDELEGRRFHREGERVLHLRQETLVHPFEAPPGFDLLPRTAARDLTTPDLLRSWNPDTATELARRLGLPIASCALLLVGIALGFSHARFHRGGAIPKSLGVILGYYLVMKPLETQLQAGRWGFFPLLLALPFAFLAFGAHLLRRRFNPHRSQGLRLLNPFRSVLRPLLQRLAEVWRRRILPLGQAGAASAHRSYRSGVLRHWGRGLWWKNWGATLATFLALNLLIEYAGLAGDLSKNQVSPWLFLQYWAWKLPPFLGVVLPLAFLFGGVLTLSEMTLSREWTALRAGGVSLLQVLRSTARGWMGVLLATFLLQAFLAPVAQPRAQALFRRLLGRPPKVQETKPWLHLGSTGTLWFLEGAQRWGFPLKAPGEAPALLRWHLNDARAEALSWDGLGFSPGPEASLLFPDRALRNTERADHASTLDLFRWQRWAPDPERATLLWSRLLNWLAGPILLFAMLPHAFPGPRAGRGHALAASLVAGLVFLGSQAVFGGAAQAGELPPLWGVLAPQLLLLGYGLMHLRRLRT